MLPDSYYTTNTKTGKTYQQAHILFHHCPTKNLGRFSIRLPSWPWKVCHQGNPVYQAFFTSHQLKNKVCWCHTCALCPKTLHSRQEQNACGDLKGFLHQYFLGGLLFNWFWFTKLVQKTRKGQKIAQVVICIITSTNHQYSGYENFKSATSCTRLHCLLFTAFYCFFFSIKHGPIKYRML